ncbi:MAG: tRNA (adenosine(37)-N6)-threonylcarbamoyltransferase complex transferase subunit TsaD [Candidatus Omnitrophica bacterium]|nr:tRNA (adenosine(37)-N6)-threonylcarbamoyltransferase complex transferase subunit TsaD [Candidatus Omnitrophota bacterium]
MLVLGIETSCDETGLALVEDGRKVLGSQLASSLKEHQRYGGVVPEIASRAHVELLTCELEALLSSTGVSPSRIDRIAVTFGPGLAGALLSGIAAAKALCLCWRKELAGINHLQAHLYAGLMERPDWPLDAPMVGLVISGGHTAIARMKGIRRFSLLGQTIDDAVGEAFDKVAKILHLGFPGGPEIERAAREGNPKAFCFSTPRIKRGTAYDFSLSGIKTAVLYKVREEIKRAAVGDTLCGTQCPIPTEGAGTARQEMLAPGISPAFVADMAASFQQTVVEEVADKVMAACREERARRLVVGGGVVANRLLRDRLAARCAEEGVELAAPSLRLCTDNGVMVAGLGCHAQTTVPRDLIAVPNLRLEEFTVAPPLPVSGTGDAPKQNG